MSMENAQNSYGFDGGLELVSTLGVYGDLFGLGWRSWGGIFAFFSGPYTSTSSVSNASSC